MVDEGALPVFLRWPWRNVPVSRFTIESMTAH